MEKGNEAETGTATATATSTPQPGSGTAVGGGTGTDPGTGTGTQGTPAAGQGAGGQQADQSGPGGAATDEELLDTADYWQNQARIFQERIDSEIAGSNDPKELEYLRDRQDRARHQERLERQALHERQMARPSGSDPTPAEAPEWPSAEVQHPGGSRTGVDEQGRGYEVDSEGQRTDRERFDRFRPGGG